MILISKHSVGVAASQSLSSPDCGGSRSYRFVPTHQDCPAGSEGLQELPRWLVGKGLLLVSRLHNPRLSPPAL